MGAARDFEFLPSSQGAYRNALPSGADASCQASRFLGAARDALSMALLTLGDPDEESTAAKRARAAQARSFLAEAVTSLSRARIHVPGIRTHALPVVMATEPNIDAELLRLHQIGTRLTWQNHRFLPRSESMPLDPEEEAQLAVVVRGLARNERFSRYRYSVAALAGAIVAPFVGLPSVGIGLAVVGIAGIVRRIFKPRSRLQALPSGAGNS